MLPSSFVKPKGIIVKKICATVGLLGGPESHEDSSSLDGFSQVRRQLPNRHRCMRSTDARQCPFYRYLIRGVDEFVVYLT
jgi:hypothetical protein